MKIAKATFEDLPAILELQKLAFISEAQIHNNFKIQPLVQTLEEIQKEFENWTILKLIDEQQKIIGSIRANEEETKVQIGKLIIHPDFQNKGLGSRLLKEAEEMYPNKSFELLTSSKSEKNLWLYKKNGYREVKREIGLDGLEFVFLEK